MSECEYAAEAVSKESTQKTFSEKRKHTDKGGEKEKEIFVNVCVWVYFVVIDGGSGKGPSKKSRKS